MAFSVAIASGGRLDRANDSPFAWVSTRTVCGERTSAPGSTVAGVCCTHQAMANAVALATSTTRNQRRFTNFVRSRLPARTDHVGQAREAGEQPAQLVESADGHGQVD